MAWLSLYQSEVERCDRFLMAINEYIAEQGESADLLALREQWQAERAVWQFGVDELCAENEKITE